MNAEELARVANASVNEALVGQIVDQALTSAKRAAVKGDYSTYVQLQENHTDYGQRSSAAEREEVIRRLQEKGFVVSASQKWTMMSWG